MMGGLRFAAPHLESCSLSDENPQNDTPMRGMVYDILRQRLVTGAIKPDQIMSSRAIARELSISPMPVREAISRLASERVLEIKSKSSVVIPQMTHARFEDLLFCRLQLEPAAAVRAMPAVTDSLIDELADIDHRMNVGLDSGDVAAYMLGNYEFHFKIYGVAAAPTLMRLIEMLWLQFGPMMGVVFEKYGAAQQNDDQHPLILQALRDGDAQSLHQAVTADILDGMNLIKTIIR
jgi:DNA-binding GntR family transcriptional regulator